MKQMHSVNWLSDQTQTELLIISNNWVNILFCAPSFPPERCTVHTVLATTMSSARHCSVVRSISSALLSTDCFWWNTFWYRSTLAHKQIEQCRSLKVALPSPSPKPPNFLLFPVGSFSLLAPWCVYHRSPIRTSPLTQASPVRAEKLGPETPTYPQYVQSMLIGLVMSWLTWTRGTIMIFLALGWSSP